MWIFKKCVVNAKQLIGINQMGISAPWGDSNLNNCFEPKIFHYQTLSSKPFFPFIVNLYLSLKPW